MADPIAVAAMIISIVAAIYSGRQAFSAQKQADIATKSLALEQAKGREEAKRYRESLMHLSLKNANEMKKRALLQAEKYSMHQWQSFFEETIKPALQSYVDEGFWTKDAAHHYLINLHLQCMLLATGKATLNIDEAAGIFSVKFAWP